jgi:NADPH2:quinone reductase
MNAHGGKPGVSMKAAFYEQAGPSDVIRLGELPLPEPGPGEVRIRLRFSGVNPVDWKVRKGGPGRKMAFPRIVPHSDGAGDIDAVGEGVPQSRVGERVWVWNAQVKRAWGTAAEYVALPSAQAVAMPDALSYEEGACLGTPALTAAQAVRLTGIGAGATVLVQGGAGAVAQYVIQILKARGATVIATVSSAAKAALASEAGANHVIDYRREDIAQKVQAATGGIGADAMIEVNFTANAARYPGLLRAHPTIVVYGITGSEATLPVLWLMQNSATVKFFTIYDISADDRQGCLRELQGLLAAGRLTHRIGLRLGLSECARAHDIVEQSEVTGNVVLDVQR